MLSNATFWAPGGMLQDLPIKGKKRSAPSTNIQNFYSIKTRLVYWNFSKVAILRWAGPNTTTAFQNYSVWKHSTSSRVCVVHLGFFGLVTEVPMRISQRQCLVQRTAYKFRDQIFTLYILPPPLDFPGYLLMIDLMCCWGTVEDGMGFGYFS